MLSFLSPKGKISRSIFWKGNLFWFIFFIIFSICIEVGGEIFGFSKDEILKITSIYPILVYWYGTTILTIKRLHDINWSGWFAIPVMITGVLWIAIGFIEGKPDKNNIQPLSDEDADQGEDDSNLLVEMVLALDDASSIKMQDKVYIHPNIPAEKIQNAINIINTYEHNVKSKNIMIILEDNFSDDGDSGIILTKDAIYIKPKTNKVIYFNINYVRSIKVDGLAIINLIINNNNLPRFNQIEKSALTTFCEFINLYLIKSGQIEASIQVEADDKVAQVAPLNNQHEKLGENISKIINVDENIVNNFNKKNLEPEKEIKTYTNLEKLTESELLSEAELGNAEAQCFLGRMYGDGDIIEQNFEEAFKWLYRAAQQDHSEAQYIVGLMYQNGKGTENDINKALVWIKKSAEQRDANAQYEMGEIYYYGNGVDEDEKEALKWYLKSAEQGHLESQYMVGEIYYLGIDVNQDEGEAYKWYLKAAKNNHVEAQFMIGKIYHYGNGVDANIEEALKWYLQAADQGSVNAQYLLGTMYGNGDHVQQNIDEAFKWLNKAANQDHAEAQYIIGLMYKNGKGIEKDTTKALMWIKKSAEQGDIDAQHELGEMYYHGNGVAEDDAEAFKWYSKAAEQGHVEAQGFVHAMQKINPSQDEYILGVRERLKLSKSKKLPEEIQLVLQSDRYSCISESLLSNSKFSVDYENRILEQDKDILWHFAINPYLTESTQMQLAENDDVDVRSRIASNKNICDKVQAKLARDSEHRVLSALATNPNLNTNLMDIILNKQKYALATNPNLPLELLYQFSQSQDSMVRSLLAINPIIFEENNLEIARFLIHDKQQDVKAGLFENKNTDFIDRIVSELETLSDSKLLGELSNGIDFYRACIAKSNAISQNIQSKLMVDKVDYVKSILASNPVISEKTQLQLAKDEDIKVLLSLARNPNIFSSVQEKLIKNYFDDNIVRVLAINPNLSNENYNKLYNSGDNKIRKNLAKNINLPEYLQLKLSDDSVHDVLINLAENPNLTEDVQLKLVDKGDMEISNNLIMNSALCDSAELKLG